MGEQKLPILRLSVENQGLDNSSASNMETGKNCLAVGIIQSVEHRRASGSIGEHRGARQGYVEGYVEASCADMSTDSQLTRVCLKIVYPKIHGIMIIIPFLNGYFIGNIPHIFRQIHTCLK